ncbi:MAG: hypothetical protein P0119_01240 [Nitrospira sp.]|nr:hypothetical protein [Nitrospira sp.]
MNGLSEVRLKVHRAYADRGSCHGMQVLQAAALYFLLVFGAGFVLGIGRVLMVVPLLGENTAELLEMPLMLIIVAAARWIVCQRLDDGGRSSALAVGLIAVGMVLVADLSVGMWLRGMSATEVLFDRDPVSGAAYYASLLFFAVMPAVIHRLRQI